jgi:hypothetical protein
LAGIKDDDGAAIAADDVIVENEDGTFTASDGSQLDADGVPIDADGLVTGAGMEDVVDEQGNPIAADDLIFDNEDGTFTDFFGNLVDQWGGAVDVVADKVLPVALAPEAALQQPVQVDEPLPAADTAPFTLKTQDEIKQIAAGTPAQCDLSNWYLFPSRSPRRASGCGCSSSATEAQAFD